jgi:hypothetical protein
MATGHVHTVYKDEKWINEIEGEDALPGAFRTKAEAMLTGRTHAVYGQTEHLIHNMDGTIGERSSFGDAPASRPSKSDPEPTAAPASRAPQQTSRPPVRAAD